MYDCFGFPRTDQQKTDDRDGACAVSDDVTCVTISGFLELIYNMLTIGMVPALYLMTSLSVIVIAPALYPMTSLRVTV